jgi:hypothetical protein
LIKAFLTRRAEKEMKRNAADGTWCACERKRKDREMASASQREIHKLNLKSHKTQTLYERKEAQHGTIKRERSTWTYLPLYLLPTYLPTFLPSYLLISLFTYLPAFSYHESETIFWCVS